MISAIVAVDNNWGIGYNGTLLTHLPPDMKHFKEITTGHVVIMGRKTWDSLPHKPLKDRLNLVITSGEHSYTDSVCFIGITEAIARLAHVNDNEEWFIIGGGSIYEQLLPFCDRVYITRIYKDYENVDTYFPNLEKSKEWSITKLGQPLVYNDLWYQFWQYDRIS